jgi:hypothetical protein
MKRLRSHLPSPATAIAMTALVVAIGGAAFAAIPDSSGTIHACYGRDGQLRVVESAAACRRAETAIQWSQGGGGPTNAIVARARSTAAVQSVFLPPFESEGSPAIPLTGATWTQSANEVNQFVGEVEFVAPASCTLPAAPQVNSFYVVNLKVDGAVIGEAARFGGGGGIHTVPFSGGPLSLFEPSSATQRTLTADVHDHCAGDNRATVNSVKVDVLAFR